MAPLGRDPDLDLRLVRYFLAVAEHRHFGRAAAALHIAQPALSRQIRRLEAVLGVRLLERGPSGSTLTAAGAVFVPHARALIERAATAGADARAAAPQQRFTVGFTSNLIVTPAVEAVRRAHPGAEVGTRHLAWHAAHTALIDRRVDAVVTRLPIERTGLDVVELYLEERVLVVRRDHRLADRGLVAFADIAGETFAEFGDDAWDAFWRVDPRPDGTSPGRGPRVGTVEDNLESVASGAVVTLAPGSVAVTKLRPDLAVVAVTDVAPARVVLASRRGEDGPELRSFRLAAVRLRAPGASGPTDPDVAAP